MKRMSFQYDTFNYGGKMQILLNRNTKIKYHKQIYTSEFLEERINSIAFAIKNIEMTIPKHVLIFMDRTPDLICAIMAVMGLNITYIPVSTSTPKYRLKYIIENSNCDLVVTNSKYRNMFDNISVLVVEETLPVKQMLFSNEANVNNIAYIIYTSGSTGCPKGVEISYKAVNNFIEGITKLIPFGELEVISFFTEISFDIAFVESILAAIKGLTIILADEYEQKNPRKISQLITENNVSILQMTPSRMQLLKEIDNKLECLSDVKTMLIGGEIFPLSLLHTLKENTDAQIYNMYGPTETTIWSSAANLTNSVVIDIGSPLMNTEIYIIDEADELVPNGKVGEIAIAGAGVANGYTNAPELTAEKFVRSQFLNGKRMYKTGDLGKYNKEGHLVFVGRKDNQIKLNGYRIELEEIESVIRGFDGIENGIVIHVKERLIAIYKECKAIEISELKEFLREKLPAYMVPATYHRVKDFLYTLNGKIDKKGTYENMIIENEENKNQNIAERILKIIKNNIDFGEEVNLKDSFADIGIDSLRTIKIIVEIEKVFGFEFDDDMLSNTAFSSIEEMVNYVQMRIKRNSKSC